MTLVFASLGLRGLFAQRRSDRAAWWLAVRALAGDRTRPRPLHELPPWLRALVRRLAPTGDHEVRERDYFFVVSFIVWGIWAGIGLGALVRSVASRSGAIARAGTGAVPPRRRPARAQLAGGVPPAGADARLAADFAYDLLNSTPPYGILFTYGDNDTFPLWWAQEVGGVRRDVTVVCLALANTDWYMRQLRDAPARPLDERALPAVWRVGSSPAHRAAAWHDGFDGGLGDDRILRACATADRAGADRAHPDARYHALSQRHSHPQRHPAEPRPAPDRLGGHRGPELRRPRRLRGAARSRIRAAGGPARHDLTPVRPRTASPAFRSTSRPPSGWYSIPIATPGCSSRARSGLETTSTSVAATPRAAAGRSWSTPTRDGPTAPGWSGRSTWPPGSLPIPTSAPPSRSVVDSAAPDPGVPPLTRTGPLQQRPNLK